MHYVLSGLNWCIMSVTCVFLSMILNCSLRSIGDVIVAVPSFPAVYGVCVAMVSYDAYEYYDVIVVF